jgi:hypothetical protein
MNTTSTTSTTASIRRSSPPRRSTPARTRWCPARPRSRGRPGSSSAAPSSVVAHLLGHLQRVGSPACWYTAISGRRPCPWKLAAQRCSSACAEVHIANVLHPHQLRRRWCWLRRIMFSNWDGSGVLSRPWVVTGNVSSTGPSASAALADPADRELLVLVLDRAGHHRSVAEPELRSSGPASARSRIAYSGTPKIRRLVGAVECRCRASRASYT